MVLGCARGVGTHLEHLCETGFYLWGGEQEEKMEGSEAYAKGAQTGVSAIALGGAGRSRGSGGWSTSDTGCGGGHGEMVRGGCRERKKIIKVNTITPDAMEWAR